MGWVIWTGAAITLAGCLGLIYSVVLISRAKASAENEADLRERLQRVLPVNLASFGIAVLGLMTVVVGILLA